MIEMPVWAIVLAAVAVFIIAMLFRVGVFSKLTYVQKPFPLKYFLYLEHLGPYSKVYQVFQNINNNCVPHFKGLKTIAGVFYDSPSDVIDQNHCRACCGVFIEESEKEAALQFAAKNPLYKFKEFPATECVSTTFSYHGVLTHILMSNKVYPGLTQYALQNGLVKVECEIPAMIEIYHMHLKPAKIEYVLPYGAGKENFIITTQPQPAYKPSHKKAK